MEITYTNHEGFYLPNLTLPRKEEASFGRYGRLRLKYLKEHRKVLYINLLTSGELTRHLNETDRQAREMLELLVKQMAQAQGITEQMKAEDQMTWIGAMNNIRSAAEERIIRDLINSFFTYSMVAISTPGGFVICGSLVAPHIPAFTITTGK